MSNKKPSEMIGGAYYQLDILKEKILKIEEENKKLARENTKLRQEIEMLSPPRKQDDDKPQIGDKYIIEIESHMTNKHGDLYGIKGFNALVFDKNGLDRLEKLADEYTIAGWWTPRMPVTDDEDATFF